MFDVSNFQQLSNRGCDLVVCETNTVYVC